MLIQESTSSVSRLRCALDAAGFALLRGPVSNEDFESVANSMGTVIGDTPVRVVPGRGTYLTSPDAIPLHTDHVVARWIAWRCEAQDSTAGAMILVDGRLVIESLDASTCERLASMRLPSMVRLGDPPVSAHVLGNEGGRRTLFFAPWLKPLEYGTGTDADIANLRAAIADAARAPCVIRLEPGEVLLVDNRRMLHGRDRIHDRSERRLRRLWVASRDMRH